MRKEIVLFFKDKEKLELIFYCIKVLILIKIISLLFNNNVELHNLEDDEHLVDDELVLVGDMQVLHDLGQHNLVHKLVVSFNY